jgi:hypothetical protein
LVSFLHRFQVVSVVRMLLVRLVCLGKVVDVLVVAVLL